MPDTPLTPPPADAITGLVLAGGQGLRMGGADKGLLPYGNATLAAHALARLRPQVGACALSANRHLDTYGRLGVPVWPDTLPDHPGPLAGLLAGLAHAGTPWLVSVPCDSPDFPPDLVARLAAAAAAASAPLAVAATRDASGALRRQPVFCLAQRRLAPDLHAFLAAGGRKVGQWLQQQGAAVAVFDDARAFANANTPDELQRLRGA